MLPIRTHPLLLRRRISPAEAVDLLDEVMPTASDYAQPEPLASILRRGGWSPVDLSRLWWQVTTEQDAATLAAHSPYWWQSRGWLFNPGGVTDPAPAQSASLLGGLVAREIRPDLAELCLRTGVTDLDTIAALRAPVIPDDASRVRYTGFSDRDTHFDIDPVAARQRVQKYVQHWVWPVVIDSDVRPLHIASSWHGDRAHFVAWSDGVLSLGQVDPPADIPSGDPSRPWHRAYRDFGATQDLLHVILLADNRAQLGGEVWLPWRDATSVDTATVDTHTTNQPIGTTQTAQRELRLLQHTVHGADGQSHHVWQIDDEVTIDTTTAAERTPRRVRWTLRHTVHTDPAQAQQAWIARHDELPVVATVEEIAVLAGISRDALVQAFSRARKAESLAAKQAVRTFGGTFPERLVPYRITEITGPAHWYEPREDLTWLRTRPGHGPGRGHKKPR